MNESYTLEKLFASFPGGICVPRIQRGYVQGRQDDKGESIFAEFVPVLVNAVFGTSPLSLDFLYGVADGTDEKRRLLPLDGQQRLTTLALLAWLCEKWQKEWRFDYEARRIPQLFMEGLLGDVPPAKRKPSDAVRASSWFLPVWEDDPSVAGMLRMLDALDENIDSRDRTKAKLENVTFLLHGIVGTGDTFDHIFRKMNARGKELSPWDNMKAMLDKHLDKCDSKEMAKEWRDKIDGDWAECIWKGVGGGIVKLDNALEKIIRMAYARVAGFDAQKATLWQMDNKLSSEGEDALSKTDISNFFQSAATYFKALSKIAGCWTEDRAKNVLWGTTAEETDSTETISVFWEWLSNGCDASLSDILRISFLVEESHCTDGSRRRRILLNLLDNTDDSNVTCEMLQKGLAFLSDGDWVHLVGFHKEQLADEKWKANFDASEIVDLERHPLVWLGSTAFLGETCPKDMQTALLKLQEAIKTDRKGLFLSLLGLSKKCDAGLPCGSIWIPEVDKDWAEECFSAKRLFLRKGVVAWLKNERYNTDSGSSAWLNYLSDLWDTVENYGLKRIATKDAGWLFCVGNSNLTNDAIRMIRRQVERKRLESLDGVEISAEGIPYITWGMLPYNGFMKAKDEKLYFNVKWDSWWNSSNPDRYSYNPDEDSFKLVAGDEAQGNS